MAFAISHGNPETVKTACIVTAVFGPDQLSPSAMALDAASGGHISGILAHGDLTGDAGRHLLIHTVPGIKAARILIIDCGKEISLSAHRYKRVNSAAANQLKRLACKDAVCYLPEIEVSDHTLAWRVRQTIAQFSATRYRFDRFKTKKPAKTTPALGKVWLGLGALAACDEINAALAQGEAQATAMALTKDLANLPGNICTPTYLAAQARTLAKKNPALTVTVLGETEMKTLGMGALLAVSKGSRQAAKFIILEYAGKGKRAKGKKTKKPIVLVGKGVTFDSGGISIKPSPNMDEMKYDMCGAAAVLGTLAAVSQLKLPLNVIGVIPATENMPGGAATRPGDIVTSLSGKTIEILNTDAEGRLILADALTYVERFKPTTVIDIATLTGACVVALGAHASGLISNHQGLASALLEAGQEAADPAWELPLWDEYQQQLDSAHADIANIGGRDAGTITAGCFLSRFAGKFEWAHLDIAGTAWRGGKTKGATGRPVALLLQYLINQCAS